MSTVKVKTGFMNVCGGHQLYWREHGEPQGDPMLIIHGGSGSVFDMEKFTAHRDTHLRLIEVHQRGMGLSNPSGCTKHNSIESNTADIELLRETMGIDKWSIFSWSFGAVFMASYALQYPERCERLITYAPYLGSEEDFQVGVQNHPEVMRQYYAANFAVTGEDTVRHTFAMASSGDLASKFSNYYESMKLWDPSISRSELLGRRSYEEWVKFLNMRQVGAQLELELFDGKYRFLERLIQDSELPKECSVTLVYGENDPWAAPNSYGARIFPLAENIVVPKAGHDVHTPEVQLELERIFKSKWQASPLMKIA